MTPEEKFIAEQNEQIKFYDLSKKDIDELKNVLPKKETYEFMNHAFFEKRSLSLEELRKFKSTWNSWAAWDYPIHDLIRFNKIIIDNLHHIKQKTILDFPSSIGNLSYILLDNNAKYVKLRDVYKFKLDIASAAIESNYSNFDTDITDVYDLKKVTKDLETVDTILFSGMAYHIRNHAEILQCFSKSSAKTLIVESCLSDTVEKFKEFPFVYYYFEPSAESNHSKQNASNNSLFFDNILVGEPSPKYLDDILFYFGWNKESYVEYKKYDLREVRFVSVYTR